MYKKLHIKIVNSWLWYHLYYKHTKRHKLELEEVRNNVLKLRKGIIGR